MEQENLIEGNKSEVAAASSENKNETSTNTKSNSTDNKQKEIKTEDDFKEIQGPRDRSNKDLLEKNALDASVNVIFIKII